ncbi:poly-gamma-glutamate biosynthesis protein [Longispora fulva]|nr:poly-gamma-glutamate biosynthesis protein [Longispora fulva]
MVWIVTGALAAVAALGGGGWYLTSGGGPAPASASVPAFAGTPTPLNPDPAAVTRDTAGRRTLTVLGAGDVLPHPELWQQASKDGGGAMDFLPVLSGAAPAVSASDLAICHLETALAPDGGPFEGYPTFSVPPTVVGGIRRSGFDACSTASTHALDHGEEGAQRTLTALDQAGLGHTGTFSSAAAAAKPTIYTVKGVKVGHLSYSKRGTGPQPPDGKAWLVNQVDVAAILAAAHRTRQAGAEIVVLSMTWGTEYENEPDADQQQWAKKLIASPDIDLILGHHANVVQPVEKISGKWVVYGMGNLLARHAEPVNANREGVMMRSTFVEVSPHKWQVSHLEAIPIWMDLNPDIRLVDLTRALADPAVPEGKKAIYHAAMGRIRDHLLSHGAEANGLVVPQGG